MVGFAAAHTGTITVHSWWLYHNDPSTLCYAFSKSVYFYIFKEILVCSQMSNCVVQIENEYGSFGSDHVYLHHLLDTVREHLGNNVIMYNKLKP
jgi:hypothetical protein